MRKICVNNERLQQVKKIKYPICKITFENAKIFNNG
jgi:hypothetical protein